MPIAYVDESERHINGRHIYLLAAAIPFVEDCSSYQADLVSLLLPSRDKLHWYRAVDSHKWDLINAVSRFDVMHCVTLHDMDDGERTERARMKCLEMMAFEIETFGVEFAIIESRMPKLDNKDLRHLNFLRASGSLRTAIKARHVAGRDEPLLWVADVVAGAVGDREVLEVPEFADALNLQIHEVWTDGRHT